MHLNLIYNTTRHILQIYKCWINNKQKLYEKEVNYKKNHNKNNKHKNFLNQSHTTEKIKIVKLEVLFLSPMVHIKKNFKKSYKIFKISYTIGPIKMVNIPSSSY